MTVYITSRATETDMVYHINKSCQTIQRPELLREREIGELRDEYRPCKHPGCTGEYVGGDHESHCPLCDKVVTILPNHLPECPER